MVRGQEGSGENATIEMLSRVLFSTFSFPNFPRIFRTIADTHASDVRTEERWAYCEHNIYHRRAAAAARRVRGREPSGNCSVLFSFCFPHEIVESFYNGVITDQQCN